jgi:DNA-binding Lrp family transcriptional regulator
MAKSAGMDVEQFLSLCRQLQARGVMRRFSASINHNQAGFSTNALACWNVPRNAIDIAGNKLASLKEVSHCYERQYSPQWNYNLYAMVHCRSRKQCQSLLEKACEDIGVTKHEMLYTKGELKKTRITYLV